MYIAAFEGDFSRYRIEVFKLQLSYFTAIHCVGPVATELLHIELQWSNDARLPEYLTLVSGLFMKESIYTPISTRISSLLTV